MDEQAELKAKIAAMTGAINQRRRVEPYPPPASYASNQSHRGAGRWASRGRGPRVGYHHPRQSQNLVWKAGGTPTPPSSDHDALPDADIPGTPPAGTNPRSGFILPPPSAGKRELMNKDTYEREQKQKQEYQQARAFEPQPKTSPPTPKAPVQVRNEQTTRNIIVEGMTFQVSADGSKLLRMSDLSNVFQETPKKTTVAGVDFHRTKRGNLMRAPAQDNTTRFNNSVPRAQCETFTRQGSCPFGPKCRFAHDPEKVSICKAFLKNGTCTAGDYCDLSHEMTYHRVSACTHFLRGNCTNDACRYPHVNISPSAPVCRAFATLGYCASGDRCSRRHVFECPNHANRGVCTKQNCQLPHVDRASVMRKAAQRQAKMGSEGESDLSSDDGGSDGDASDHESELDEIDDATDVAMAGVDNSHALSQQQDYVAFS